MRTSGRKTGIVERPPRRPFWLPDLTPYGDVEAQVAAYHDAAWQIHFEYDVKRILARVAYGFALLLLLLAMIDWDVSRWSKFAIMIAGFALSELTIRIWTCLMIRNELTRCLDDRATQCRRCGKSILASITPSCPACHREITRDQQLLIATRFRRGLDTNPAIPTMLERWQMAGLRNDLVEMLDDELMICRKCGYSLVKNTSGHCPECGTAIDDVQRGTIDAREEAEAWAPPRPDQPHNPTQVMLRRKRKS